LAAAIRKRLRADLVRDPIHDAVSEGDAIDGLGVRCSSIGELSPVARILRAMGVSPFRSGTLRGPLLRHASLSV